MPATVCPRSAIAVVICSSVKTIAAAGEGIGSKTPARQTPMRPSRVLAERRSTGEASHPMMLAAGGWSAGKCWT